MMRQKGLGSVRPGRTDPSYSGAVLCQAMEPECAIQMDGRQV